MCHFKNVILLINYAVNSHELGVGERERDVYKESVESSPEERNSLFKM